MAKAKKKPAPRGRPTKYTRALGMEICDRLADGETLRGICRDKHMPDERSVREWAYNSDHEFSPHYAKARETGYMRMAEEILTISDDKGDDGVNPQSVARARLRVDTRKWLMAKALPKIYGDKVLNEHTGKDGEPIEVQDTEAARRVAFMLGRAVERGKTAVKENAED